MGMGWYYSPSQLCPCNVLYFLLQTCSSQQHMNFSRNHLDGIQIKINRKPFCNQTQGGTGKKHDRSQTWRRKLSLLTAADNCK